MSNPTSGTLRTSVGLSLDNCNPSFLWSDDSRYLALAQFNRRFGCIRVQRVLVVDVVERVVRASPKTAFYYQPEAFEDGVLTVTREPLGSRKPMSWRIPSELDRFKLVNASRWESDP